MPETINTDDVRRHGSVAFEALAVDDVHEARLALNSLDIPHLRRVAQAAMRLASEASQLVVTKAVQEKRAARK